MSKQNQKSKRNTHLFEVFNGKELVLTSKKSEEVEVKVAELKKSAAAKIIVRTSETSCIVHTKDRYEKNYRIRTENFVPIIAPPTKADNVEHEEKVNTSEVEQEPKE